jgi:hypothetical protein
LNTASSVRTRPGIRRVSSFCSCSSSGKRDTFYQFSLFPVGGLVVEFQAAPLLRFPQVV